MSSLCVNLLSLARLRYSLHMSLDALTPQQLAARGDQLYQEKLKPVLEPAENGRFVAIDVESGEYFIGDTILQAHEEAYKRFPNKVLHTIRIGHEGIFKLSSMVRSSSYGWNSRGL